MSTAVAQQQQETEAFVGFTPIDVPVLPVLACLGYVEEVGAVKITDSKEYYRIPVKLHPKDGGKYITIGLLFRPEWVHAGFDPRTLPGCPAEPGDRSKGMHWVYGNNIHNKSKKVSLLQGLCGSKENFVELQREVLTRSTPVEPEEFCDILRDFLTRKQQGAILGYKLKQKQEKTDAVDETGKTIYDLVDGYDIDTFFSTDEKNVAGLVRYATKNPKKMKVTFEVD